jgi:hypothetical protein
MQPGGPAGSAPPWPVMARPISAQAIIAFTPGRSHFTLAQQGREDVADFALNSALDPTEDIKSD